MVAHSLSVRSLGYRRPSSLYFSRSLAVHMLISLHGISTADKKVQSNRLSNIRYQRGATWSRRILTEYVEGNTDASAVFRPKPRIAATSAVFAANTPRTEPERRSSARAFVQPIPGRLLTM